MGFGMEMSDAGELTDKFAHSIQKSLIEWDDLASSVKFAMPFFVATGQSVDELLGGLEVLTNRALEAGIAGRGLRQALAQFAKHADDNASAMAKLGVEIMDTEGNMRDLHEIAKDASAAFGDVTDLEALTAMLEDMNVRGATAFALLVQNADEFEAAVGDISNAAGSATEMADIQQQSLAMQIQRVKNALLAPFLLSDSIGEANNTLNEFTLRIKELVDEFVEFFIIIGPDGQETYSQHGQALKEFVIAVLNEAVHMVRRLKDVFLDQEEGFTTFIDLLQLAVLPMELMLDVLDFLGPSALKWYAVFKLFTGILPIHNLMMGVQLMMQTKLLFAKQQDIALNNITFGQMLREMGMIPAWLTMKNLQTVSHWLSAEALLGEAIFANTAAKSWMFLGASIAVAAAKTAIFLVGAKILMDTLGKLGAVIAAFAALQYLGALSSMFGWYSKYMLPPFAVAATAATGLAAAGAMWLLYNKFVASASSAGHGGQKAELPELKFNKERTYDLGGMVAPATYDNGGMSTEHQTAILQKGETVVPKTQNMLGGGITLNFGDINAQDGTDFAEKVASALPDALRRVNDQGAV